PRAPGRSRLLRATFRAPRLALAIAPGDRASTLRRPESRTARRQFLARPGSVGCKRAELSRAARTSGTLSTRSNVGAPGQRDTRRLGPLSSCSTSDLVVRQKSPGMLCLIADAAVAN